MKKLLLNTYFIIIHISQYHSHGIVMRNNALMSKMVSHFQDKENLSTENSSTTEKPHTNVLGLMQNVLCRNFPSIPCDMIVQDETLRKLIEKSIQQIKYKKLNMERTTPSTGTRLTLFPVINSEDLSNFLQVSEIGYFSKDAKSKQKSKKSVATNFWSREVTKKRKNKKNKKRTSVFNGRKKIRKFYPHKIKYKDKSVKHGRREYQDYSEEKLSMSVETPEVSGRKSRVSFKAEPSDPPVWRIDYMKHGEPSFNMFPYETDRLKGKIMQTGANVVVDENVLEHASRKDVLHPDVYIKNNFVRKNAIESDEMESV
ncbi:hypothetical protein K1T71_012477 [Dendrolimus kikuchii]|uniref:Uncharacterized protein n=1 Tax=Dendrolimus kikuchii TaxID=765133 RepID=A0ACC1CJU3_9NEOP|nr:hypothetical protein K1T71_012477 [Dendrolimus kikuchii]